MNFLKIVFGFILSIFVLILNPTNILAEESANLGQEFSVDSEINYKVLTNGTTIVTHNIVLENLFSTLYATTYVLSLENIKALNVKSNDGNAVDVQRNEDKTDIKLTFSDVVVGKGEKRSFFISYENPTFAVKTGEVWEITVPKIEGTSGFRKYSVNLEIPKDFGEKAYISPDPISEKSDNSSNIYTFSKEQITKSGVTAGFGQFQVFSYNLAYHLENPINKTLETQIALPPDTAFQKVFIEKIEPRPKNVIVDIDGNWLAVYELKPRERVDVNVAGSVQIFAGYRHFMRPNEEVLMKNLAGTDYWQVDDPQIKELAKTYKTPYEIYKFVSTKLKYDYDRVTPNVTRFGALEALKNPNSAICMEFTDLFVAIARAAGIPAREINGYAYTENKDLQPLGLVADVLHSWPEYYDSVKGVWVPIDPTWASTTGGEDFFNKLDLRHFAFVIHGVSDTKPFAPGSYKLGPSPQKDVFVSFGKLTEEKANTPSIDLSSNKTFTIYNNGKTALYNLTPKIYFDNVLKYEETIEVLTPYSNYQKRISIPFSILAENTPNLIKVTVGDVEAEIPTNKKQTIIYSLVFVCIVLLLILLFILVKIGKIRLNVKKPITPTS